MLRGLQAADRPGDLARAVREGGAAAGLAAHGRGAAGLVRHDLLDGGGARRLHLQLAGVEAVQEPGLSAGGDSELAALGGAFPEARQGGSQVVVAVVQRLQPLLQRRRPQHLGEAGVPPSDRLSESRAEVGVLLPRLHRLRRPVPLELGRGRDQSGVQRHQVASDLIGLARRHPGHADAVGIVAVDFLAALGVRDDHAGADPAEAGVDGVLQRGLVEPLVRAGQLEWDLEGQLGRNLGLVAPAERQGSGHGECEGPAEAHAALFTSFCSPSRITWGA